MAIAFGAAWTGLQGNSVTSLTTGSITSSGNFVGVAVTNNNALAASNPVTDSKSNTYQKALGPITASTDDSYIYYAENATTGASHTITATSSVGSSFMTISAASYSGLATSGSLDKTTSGSGSSTSLSSGNTATTTSANELLLGSGTFSTGSTITFSAGASYTVRSQIGFGSIGGTGFIEDRIVSATGAYSASATESGGSASNWVCLIATFSDGGGGGNTGTLAATLGAVTLTGASTLSISATVAQTLGALTLAGNGTLSITGTLAQTLGALVLAGNSTLAISGTLAQTLGALTLQAADTASNSATLSSALGTVTLASNGTLSITGTLAGTLGTMTVASASTLGITGQLAKTLGVLTLVASDGAAVPVVVSRYRRTILLTPLWRSRESSS